MKLLWVVALAAWVVAWAALALARAARTGPRVRTVARAVAWSVFPLAVGAAGLAWWGARALDPRGLAVVARPETMHVAPGADADAMGGVATGDVVRIVERRGEWQRVLHADGREGWLPALRLVAIVPDVPAATD